MNARRTEPSGWATTTLKELLPINYGKGLTKANRNTSGKVPVFGSSGAVDCHDSPLTNGPTIVVGRKGNVGEVYFSPVPCWPIDTTYFSEGSHSTNLKFFSHLLRFAQLARLDRSTAIPGLSRDDYDIVQASIPPLAEQHRIVEAIESYLTRLDEAVATLERVQRNLKRYRASVLKAAVEGRLVPTEAELARKENREYEPASVLLARILKERKHRFIKDAAEKGRAKAEAKAKSAGKTWTDADDEKTLAAERAKAAKRYQEPVAPDASELPELPEGWCRASVEQLGFIASGQTPQGITTAGASEGNIPWFRVGDMNAEGNETYMRVGRDWLSDAQIFEFGLHVRPPETIVFPKRGGAIRTNKKRLLSVSSTYDLNTMGIIPVQPTGPYLWMWFMRVDLGSLSDGSNVPQLNHGDIAPLSVPLPPLEEQSRIIAEAERRISVQEAADHVAGENVRRANGLRQSILKWAFEGKLADQDPDDEPASVLLDRIKAERSASEPATKATRSRRKRKTA